MDREEELEVVNTACTLEYMIVRMNEEVKSLKGERPRRPSEPQLPKQEYTKIDPTPYPTIEPPKVALPPFSKRGIIILGVSLAVLLPSIILNFVFYFDFSLNPNYSTEVGTGWFITIILILLSFNVLATGGVLLIIDYSMASATKKKILEQKTEEIRNSPEYQEQCHQIDEQNKVRQDEVDKKNLDDYYRRCDWYRVAYQQYEIVLKDYEEQQIPEWKAEIADLNNMIEFTNRSLQDIYDENIIPFNCRNITALTFLTMYMRTSNYDLKFAIEQYNAYVSQSKQDVQIMLAEQRLQLQQETILLQQYTNSMNQEIISLLEEGNRTLNSIDSFQKADIIVREYRRYKARKEARKR